MTPCICDWPRTCGGSGMLECRGCGGDQCVCAACGGQGVKACLGCDDCAYLDDDLLLLDEDDGCPLRSEK